MTNEKPIESLFEQLEEQVEGHGWAYSYLTPLLLNDSKEKQKKILRFELPTQIYFALDDQKRFNDIKAAMKYYPHLKPEMAKIISNLKSNKLFKNLADDKSKILKRVINELNKSVSNME